ncbi:MULTISPECIES: helix-turn-helix transcriptional regulator [Phaeobacter]|uniref:helix-turn-helix transcriptional regulator n=1 Tax=Phaeobacter TaxID=302485 RepID=UPI0021A9767A|nr:hypothetical protein [Phaeobacter inhibens]UWR74829.1 hypothetical protein K4L04_10060 [Phaeobacter inhibens]
MQFLQEAFSGYGFVILAPGEAPQVAETSFADSWHEKYFSEGLHEYDPVFDFLRGSGGRSGAKLLSESEMGSPLYEEAEVFGADSNFVSTSSFGGNTLLLGGVNHDLDERALPNLLHSCRALHRSVLLKRVDSLSDSQIDFMEMSEEGLLDKQIASTLDVSISAVAQRKKAICVKLGIGNFRAALSLYSIRKWSGIVPVG